METRDTARLLELAQELTRLLNTDEEFRRELADDPVRALGRLGHPIKAEDAELIRKALTTALLEAQAFDGGIVPFIVPA